jgi:hypothetical protein
MPTNVTPVGNTTGLAIRAQAHLFQTEQAYVKLTDDPGFPIEIQSWVGYSAKARMRLTRRQAQELAALLSLALL